MIEKGYKGKETDAKTIGKELNVQAILNGRLVERGDQLTLSLELIDAQTENVIWSEQYDRKQADLVSLQRELARDVSTRLKSKLSGADVAKVEKNSTTNPEAYQLYLKGKFYWNKRTGESLKQAAEFYRQAIEKDPNTDPINQFALRDAGIAYAKARRPDKAEEMISGFREIAKTQYVATCRLLTTTSIIVSRSPICQLLCPTAWRARRGTTPV